MWRKKEKKIKTEEEHKQEKNDFKNGGIFVRRNIMQKLICALQLLGCLNPLEESTAEKMSLYKNYHLTPSASTSLLGGIWSIHYGEILLISSFQIHLVVKTTRKWKYGSQRKHKSEYLVQRV